MAPRITFIKDIKAGKIDWRIKVRVLHMWKIPEYNNPNITKSMEIVLLDEKSGKIQASIKQNLLDMFENTLEEGSCYLIQNLLVAQNDPKFRATDHKYKLTFMRTTMCMKTDAATIPENVFKFVTFPEICTGLDESYLIDVIGHVVQRHDMKETEKNGVRSLLMDIVLEDLQGNRIDCNRLYFVGNIWRKMHNYLMQNTENGLVVVILQGCKMRIFNGKIGISTSFDTTKLLINPDLKECTDYKEKLENGNRSVTPGVSYISGQSSMSITDDFLQTPRMTISDIMDVDKVNSIANTPCANKNKGKRIFEEVDFGSPVDGCGPQNSSTKMPKLNEIKKEPNELMFLMNFRSFLLGPSVTYFLRSTHIFSSYPSIMCSFVRQSLSHI